MSTQEPAASDGAADTPPDSEPEPEPEPEPRLARAATALSDAVAWLTGGRLGSDDGPVVEEAPDRKGAAAALGAVVSALASGARAGGKGAAVGGGFLVELLGATAARLPLRDKATLLEQHPDLDTERLADELVGAASRVTAAIGGAAGGLAAAQWFAAPSLIAVPVEVAAETLLVAAIELKLVAELHEIYDARPPGDRSAAYLEAWTTQRGAGGQGTTTGLASQLTAAGTAALRKRLTGRLVRNLGSFLPFLAGAVIGARYNASATRKLGERLRSGLAFGPQVVPSQRLHPNGLSDPSASFKDGAQKDTDQHHE